jgi:hypothetical protein
LVRIEETAVNALSQEIERSAFHGGSVPDSTPYVLSHESQFSAGCDFNAGNDERLNVARGLEGLVTECVAISTTRQFHLSNVHTMVIAK